MAKTVSSTAAHARAPLGVGSGARAAQESAPGSYTYVESTGRLPVVGSKPPMTYSTPPTPSAQTWFRLRGSGARACQLSVAGS